MKKISCLRRRATICTCQFESGHSLECPLYVEQKNPLEWRERFDEDFSSRIIPYPTTSERIVEWQTERDKSIKSFIAKEKSLSYQEALKEVLELVGGIEHKKQQKLHGGYDDADFLNTYSLALSDLRREIEKLLGN